MIGVIRRSHDAGENVNGDREDDGGVVLCRDTV